MKYLVVTGDWDRKIGGSVCLHKLCHVINELGGDAYIARLISVPVFASKGIYKDLASLLRFYSRLMLPRLIKTSPELNTPIFSGSILDLRSDEWVIIYPEVVNGNPYAGKNVVRWLLHNPAFHTGSFCYNRDDVAVRFNSAISDFNINGLLGYKGFLKVIDYPKSIFNKSGALSSEERFGSAYCIRKGKGKELVHDLRNSILIDTLSLEEIGEIFKRVKYFVSYDTYTALSLFAIMCGCHSIVVPDDGVSEFEWYPDPGDRLGIYYGKNYSGAEPAGVSEALERIDHEIESSKSSVKDFMIFVDDHFGK